MAMTNARLRRLAAELARRIYMGDITATHSLEDLRQAVQNIDDSMNASCNAAATKYGATSVKAALLAEAQEAATNLTNPQLVVAFALWALAETGMV